MRLGDDSISVGDPAVKLTNPREPERPERDFLCPAVCRLRPSCSRRPHGSGKSRRGSLAGAGPSVLITARGAPPEPSQSPSLQDHAPNAKTNQKIIYRCPAVAELAAPRIVYIIAPYNFPFYLTFGPLIASISAGNCVRLSALKDELQHRARLAACPAVDMRTPGLAVFAHSTSRAPCACPVHTYFVTLCVSRSGNLSASQSARGVSQPASRPARQSVSQSMSREPASQ